MRHLQATRSQLAVCGEKQKHSINHLSRGINHFGREDKTLDRNGKIVLESVMDMEIKKTGLGSRPAFLLQIFFGDFLICCASWLSF